MKRHRYTTSEIKWLGEDYTEGMKMTDVMKTYGLNENQVRYAIKKYNILVGNTNRRKRQPKYIWALVTADEKELPVTAYYDTARELAESVGMKLDTIYGARTRGFTSRYRTREGVIKVRAIKIDVE